MLQVSTAYDQYQFDRVPLMIEKFINTHVSGFYFHVTKDRIYCSSAVSAQRRSGQTVQHHILHCLLHAAAPILPHLADEVYTNHHQDPSSIFRTLWPEVPADWHR